MIQIKDGVIYIHHGDDAAIPVNIINPATGQQYHLQTGDTLKFTVRALPVHSSPELLTVQSSDEYIIITHTMTESIPAGKYSCDLQLTRANGMVTTVFPALRETGSTSNLKNFIVDAEVSD